MRRMLHTIEFSRGDVVLVNFMFSEGTDSKRRPAVLVSSQIYHQGRQETVLCAITSNTERLLIGDYLMADWDSAGLLYRSVATGIIRTIKQSMIQRKLGSVSRRDMDAIDDLLKANLDLVD